MADQDRDGPFLMQFLHVEFEPHHEHEEHQPQLAEGIQNTEAVSWEEKRPQLRSHPAEERWSEQDPCQYLTDHPRLANLFGQRPHDPGDQDDHGELRYQYHQIGDAGCRALTLAGLRESRERVVLELCIERCRNLTPQGEDQEQSCNRHADQSQVSERQSPFPDGFRGVGQFLLMVAETRGSWYGGRSKRQGSRADQDTRKYP
jgi:hypothetical protein